MAKMMANRAADLAALAIQAQAEKKGVELEEDDDIEERPDEQEEAMDPLLLSEFPDHQDSHDAPLLLQASGWP